MSQNITLSKAISLTTLYRNQREAILLPEHRGNNILPLCETFDRSVIESLLAQPGCQKLRIYYGMEESLAVQAVLVGTNEEDEDILPLAGLGETDEGEGDIAGDGYRCPPVCPPPSPLNE